MNEEIEQTKTLLRDLAARLVEHPEAIEIGSQASEKGDAVYFAMKGHREDEPRLIGYDGSHVRAIELLVVRLGQARGKVYTFRLITEGEPKEPAERRHVDVVSYDTGPTGTLVSRVLSRLPIVEYCVAVTPGDGPRTSLSFLFTIFVKNRGDYRELIAPGDDGQTLIAALGTLFRAIAKRDGVRFKFVVEMMKPQPA